MTGISALPPQLQERLRAELKAGESVAWAARPDPRRYLHSCIRKSLFFIPWIAFGVLWMALVSGMELPGVWGYFRLIGLLFIASGVGGLLAPLWQRRRADTTVYAITDLRAICMEGSRSLKVKSYAPADISGIERTEHADGTGDLVLRTETYRDADGDPHFARQGFFAIPDVRRAETLAAALKGSPSADSAENFRDRVRKASQPGIRP